MLRLIVFLAIAIAAAFAAVWLADQPGGVAIVWGTSEVRTSLAVMVAALIAFAAVVVVLFELLRWLRGVPRRVRRHRSQSRERRGYEALSNGLIAAAAGDVARARHLNRQAAKLVPQQPGVMLLAAQTAQLEGQDEAARQRFRAMLKRPETELLGLRGLLAGAAKIGDREEALELARQAHRRSPDTPWVISTLFDLLIRADHWSEAQQLMDGLVRHRLVSEADVGRRRAILHYMTARQQRQRDDLPSAQKQVKRALKLDAGFVPASVLGSELALSLNQKRYARRILEAGWSILPHPEIARAYAQLVPGETPAQRLERFQRLARIRPGDQETLIMMGELAIAAHRHEAARQHLERAMETAPTQRACRLMAELARAEGAPAAKVQEWQARAVEARPDRAWVCEDTGNVVAHWTPFSPGGAFDAIRWTEPPQLMTLLPGDRATFMLIDAEPETGEPPTQGGVTPRPSSRPPLAAEPASAPAA
jgi:HemY protein